MALPTPSPRRLPHPEEFPTLSVFAETDEWFVCGPTNLPRQGWKLYVSASVLNAADIFGQLIPVLVGYHAHFKYVRDLNVLRRLNAGAFGYSQIGKCLVVYLPSVRSELIRDVTALLEPYRDRCPVTPFARPFGDGLPMSYRYGSYTDSTIEVGGRTHEDVRNSLAHAVPEGVADELLAFTRLTQPDSRFRRFLLRYPAFRAVAQQGKSGIFRALNLQSESYAEVVLKVGYPNGQTQADGSDGCTFLRRELAFYRALERRGVAEMAPLLLDAYDDGRRVVLVLEALEAESLLTMRLNHSLTVQHLDACWEMIHILHERGLYLGDAKIANFLSGKDGIRVIDFETSGVIGEAHPSSIRTFSVEHPTPSNAQSADLAHFLVSVLFPYENARYGEEDRKIDLRDYLTSIPQSEFQQWAWDRLVPLASTL